MKKYFSIIFLTALSYTAVAQDMSSESFAQLATVETFLMLAQQRRSSFAQDDTELEVFEECKRAMNAWIQSSKAFDDLAQFMVESEGPVRATIARTFSVESSDEAITINAELKSQEAEWNELGNLLQLLSNLERKMVMQKLLVEYETNQAFKTFITSYSKAIRSGIGRRVSAELWYAFAQQCVNNKNN